MPPRPVATKTNVCPLQLPAVKNAGVRSSNSCAIDRHPKATYASVLLTAGFIPSPALGREDVEGEGLLPAANERDHGVQVRVSDQGKEGPGRRRPAGMDLDCVTSPRLALFSKRSPNSRFATSLAARGKAQLFGGTGLSGARRSLPAQPQRRRRWPGRGNPGSSTSGRPPERRRGVVFLGAPERGCDQRDEMDARSGLQVVVS